MKYISLIVFIGMFSCNIKPERIVVAITDSIKPTIGDTIYLSKKDGSKVSLGVIQRDKYPTFQVGSRHKLAAIKLDENNPYERRDLADVIITDRDGDYVQYCWAYEYKKENRTTFSRSCDEFKEMIDRYKKLHP